MAAQPSLEMGTAASCAAQTHVWRLEGASSLKPRSTWAWICAARTQKDQMQTRPLAMPSSWTPSQLRISHKQAAVQV